MCNHFRRDVFTLVYTGVFAASRGHSRPAVSATSSHRPNCSKSYTRFTPCPKLARRPAQDENVCDLRDEHQISQRFSLTPSLNRETVFSDAFFRECGHLGFLSCSPEIIVADAWVSMITRNGLSPIQHRTIRLSSPSLASALNIRQETEYENTGGLLFVPDIPLIPSPGRCSCQFIVDNAL
jgi:hypothetical protein